MAATTFGPAVIPDGLLLNTIPASARLTLREHIISKRASRISGTTLGVLAGTRTRTRSTTPYPIHFGTEALFRPRSGRRRSSFWSTPAVLGCSPRTSGPWARSLLTLAYGTTPRTGTYPRRNCPRVFSYLHATSQR